MHLVRPLIISSFAIWAAMCHSAQTGPLGSGAKDDLPEMQPTEGIHALPAGTGEAPELRLGEKMKFDDLGPIIITETGEARRIENWKTLTKREQDVAWRRIGESVLIVVHLTYVHPYFNLAFRICLVWFICSGAQSTSGRDACAGCPCRAIGALEGVVVTGAAMEGCQI